jgi:hypothetical protein
MNPFGGNSCSLDHFLKAELPQSIVVEPLGGVFLETVIVVSNRQTIISKASKSKIGINLRKLYISTRTELAKFT